MKFRTEGRILLCYMMHWCLQLSHKAEIEAICLAIIIDINTHENARVGNHEFFGERVAKVQNTKHEYF